MRQCGIDDYRAGVVLEDKATWVNEMRKRAFPVAMVGGRYYVARLGAASLALPLAPA